jgi:hypothetical protein
MGVNLSAKVHFSRVTIGETVLFERYNESLILDPQILNYLSDAPKILPAPSLFHFTI